MNTAFVCLFCRLMNQTAGDSTQSTVGMFHHCDVHNCKTCGKLQLAVRVVSKILSVIMILSDLELFSNL